MALKIYMHPLSQPARAVIIFCKLNGIEFEEIVIDLLKGHHKSPEFLEINPVGQIPAIVHGDFKLFESHSILMYLASAFPGVADHWYPADVQKRAKIHSVLDWHHSNLRRGAGISILSSTGAAVQGTVGRRPPPLHRPELPLNPQAALEDDKILNSSLSNIESVWLTDDGPFLTGRDKPSIADLSLVCEILELELLDENDRNRILKPYPKVRKWIEDVKNATGPQFDEVHQTMHQFMDDLKHNE